MCTPEIQTIMDTLTGFTMTNNDPFNIGPGIIAVTGPHGSGKSTLIANWLTLFKPLLHGKLQEYTGMYHELFDNVCNSLFFLG